MVRIGIKKSRLRWRRQGKELGLNTFGKLCRYELQESPVEGFGVKPDQCYRSKRICQSRSIYLKRRGGGVWIVP